jgi:hypothetical protein
LFLSGALRKPGCDETVAAHRQTGQNGPETGMVGVGSGLAIRCRQPADPPCARQQAEGQEPPFIGSVRAETAAT